MQPPGSQMQPMWSQDAALMQLNAGHMQKCRPYAGQCTPYAAKCDPYATKCSPSATGEPAASKPASLQASQPTSKPDCHQRVPQQNNQQAISQQGAGGRGEAFRYAAPGRMACR